MSIWRDPFYYENHKENPTPEQKALANKLNRYIKNIAVEPVMTPDGGVVTFRAPNLYSKNDFGSPLLPDGTLKPSLDIRMALVKLIDLNDRVETRRRENNNPGAREIPINGCTISYAVVPLENLDENGRNPDFIIDTEEKRSGATYVFDPRLVAMSTYPKEISDAAGVAKGKQSVGFDTSFQAINSDMEFVPYYPNSYCRNALENLVTSYPYLFDNQEESQNQ